MTLTNNPERDGTEGYYEFMLNLDRASAKQVYKYNRHNGRFKKRYGNYPARIMPEFGTFSGVRFITAL